MSVISNLAIECFFEIKVWCLESGSIFAVFNLAPTHNNPALFINGSNGTKEQWINIFFLFQVIHFFFE